MTLKLNGSSSGSVSIDAPASTTGGADVIFKLPVADGTSGQVLTTNASGQLSFATAANNSVTEGSWTSVGTGTSIDISSLDSTDVIKYEILFSDVSCGGGMNWQFQLGDSGGVETSGYEVIGAHMGNTSHGTGAVSDAFRWYGVASAGFIMDGKFTLTRMNGNKWWGEGVLVRTEAGSTIYTMYGSKSLSAALTTFHISASSDDSESFDDGDFKLITYK